MTNLKRVLILEENTDHLELLTALLEEHFSPIDIHTVETIEDCLDFLEQTTYDLILTGCFIHKVQITERLKDITSFARGAPIIVVSGSGNENIAADVIKHGASEYIVKTRKSLEKLPAIVAKYFKKGCGRAETESLPPLSEIEPTGRIIRELDRLMQKARILTSNIATKSISEDTSQIESLFSQISKLRKMLQEQK